MTWKQDSHFPPSTEFPEITLHYILGLDAQFNSLQIPLKVPQCTAWLFFFFNFIFLNFSSFDSVTCLGGCCVKVHEDGLEHLNGGPQTGAFFP